MISPDEINVLIACEESQAECMAFRARGFNAFSCDLQPCRKGTPENLHIIDDVTRYLRGGVQFTTQDGKFHEVGKWHLIIAHPPCTYLCKVSAVHLRANTDTEIMFRQRMERVNNDRYEKLVSARAFFYECLWADAPFVAVENPQPMAMAELPPPSCYLQPSWYGVKYTKKTLYWLKNLPPMMPELEYPRPKSFVGASRGKYRSRTFPQVANALAIQWGSFILNELNENPDEL